MADAVILGKFMPLHKGHELMIEMAAAEFENLTIIISSNDKESFDSTPRLNIRYNILRRKYREHENVTVIKHTDQSPKITETDEYGTVINNPEFWAYWVRTIRFLAPDATYVVSSDRYGETLAKELTDKHSLVNWAPIDPDRELFNISASEIRANPYKNWKYISKEFRRFYAKKILVIGPESTGKSTLVKDLAHYWASPYVPEYGRILSESKDNNLTDLDFEQICQRHHNMISYAVDNTETGLVFIDTDAATTLLYGEIYVKDWNDEEHQEIVKKAIWYNYDLTFVLPPIIPWDDDGTRVMPDQQDRKDFYDRLLSYHYNLRICHLMESIDRKERIDEVSKLMQERLFDNIEKTDYTIN